MEIGSLIIYDDDGKVWFNSGDSQGDVKAHTPPNGMNYIITEYGQLDNKELLKVNPETKALITKEIKQKPSYEELENKILLAENENVEGGIF